MESVYSECIWRDSQLTNVPKSILSDKLSERINVLNHEIRESGLFANQTLRKKVLLEVLPKTLLNLLGLETIQTRLPDTYIVSLLSSYLSSRYVYEAGVTPNEFKFYQFMQKFM
jgi:glutamate dehydrogenase